jgi:hypothetical protein
MPKSFWNSSTNSGASAKLANGPAFCCPAIHPNTWKQSVGIFRRNWSRFFRGGTSAPPESPLARLVEEASTGRIVTPRRATARPKPWYAFCLRKCAGQRSPSRPRPCSRATGASNAPAHRRRCDLRAASLGDAGYSLAPSIPFATIGRFLIRDHNWCERIMIGVR